MSSWYRLIDPALLDPGKKYARLSQPKPDETERWQNALRQLIKPNAFHKEIISNYYHPNTYAFCGRDAHHLSYGTVRWAGNWHRADSMDKPRLRQGKPASFNTPGRVIADFGSSAQATARHSHNGTTPNRQPSIEFHIQPQDAAGDGSELAVGRGASPA